jgi:hypothetical protein
MSVLAWASRILLLIMIKIKHRPPNDYKKLREEWLHKRSTQRRIVASLEGDKHDPSEKQMKTHRARIFCDWILKTFGEDSLRRGSGVVDVAGGKGDIPFELWNKRGIPTTMVEPVTTSHTQIIYFTSNRDK